MLISLFKRIRISFENIDFQVAPGSILGITGPTGSGKSALTQLIPRFYDVADGKVIVDGHDVRKWPLQQLRQKSLWCLKPPCCLRGRFGKTCNGAKEATDEDCWRALEIAQSRDFVEALPQQLDTPDF